MIKDEINKFFNSKIYIIDSTEIITQHIKEELNKLEIRSLSKNSNYHFIVSNYTKSFEESASFFFKENIKLEEIDIWK